MSDYAFVFCMFLGGSYLPGVFVLAHSLFRTNTKYDVVCMVTHDVPQDAKDKMKAIGIKVIDVEYIYTNAYFDERPSMKGRYPHIDKYSTKWNCLKLTQYKKIFLLDIDMIVNKNIDHIFQLSAPATRLVLRLPTKKVTLGAVLMMDDGDKLPLSIAKKFLYKGMGSIDGGCILLEPSKKQYNNFLKYAKDFDPRGFNAEMTDDEFCLFSFYTSQRKKWRYLGIEWSCIQWKYKGLCIAGNALLDNFIGLGKPWDTDLSKYPDTKLWYILYNELKKKYPEYSELFKI